MKCLYKNKYVVIKGENQWRNLRKHISLSIYILFAFLGFCMFGIGIWNKGAYIKLLGFGIGIGRKPAHSMDIPNRLNLMRLWDWCLYIDTPQLSEFVYYRRRIRFSVFCIIKILGVDFVISSLLHDTKVSKSIELTFLGFHIEVGFLREIMRRKTLSTLQDYHALRYEERKPVKLNMGWDTDHSLACLLRAPDVPDIWCGKTRDSERHVFMNNIRIHVIGRIRFLCEGIPTFTEPSDDSFTRTTPLPEFARKNMIRSANALDAEPLWWKNWFEHHAEKGLGALKDHRPDREEEIDNLFEFLSSLDEIFKEKGI